MSDDYARHLAKLHAGFEAPGALVERAARTVTASPIRSRERIVAGEANEVYALGFESGLEVILRIARRSDEGFDKERWAIDRCRALGVRAPEVLSVERLESDGETVDVCLLEKLPGQRLSDSLSLPTETLRAIVREVGGQLSRMHTIGADDLGDGARFFANETDDFLPMEAEFTDIAVRAGLDRTPVERAFRLARSTLERHAARRMRLTHNDLRACHVLVCDGALSGLIDFGQVSVDSPVNEFAKWDYWEAPTMPSAWLREGYGDQSLFDETYDEIFTTLRVANALWVMRWYDLTGYAAGVERAKVRLEGYLGEL